MSDDNIKFIHNLGGQILGKIEFLIPYQFTFVYSDNRRNIFNNIIYFNSMSTGCYVLTDTDGTVFVITPTHEYIIEKQQEKAND